jgi:hypothetical protein
MVFFWKNQYHSHYYYAKYIEATWSCISDLLSKCRKLTSSSIKTIGEYCQKITSLDLCNLNRLRDSAVMHLRGCRLIRKLKLQRNAFRCGPTSPVFLVGPSLNTPLLSRIKRRFFNVYHCVLLFSILRCIMIVMHVLFSFFLAF